MQRTFLQIPYHKHLFVIIAQNAFVCLRIPCFFKTTRKRPPTLLSRASRGRVSRGRRASDATGSCVTGSYNLTHIDMSRSRDISMCVKLYDPVTHLPVTHQTPCDPVTHAYLVRCPLSRHCKREVRSNPCRPHRHAASPWNVPLSRPPPAFFRPQDFAPRFCDKFSFAYAKRAIFGQKMAKNDQTKDKTNKM